MKPQRFGVIRWGVLLVVVVFLVRLFSIYIQDWEGASICFVKQYVIWEVLQDVEVNLRTGSPIAFVIKLCQEDFLIAISRQKGLLKGLGRCEGATNSGILNQRIESPGDLNDLENRVVIAFFRIDPHFTQNMGESCLSTMNFQFPPKPCGRIPSWLLFWSIL